MGKVRVLSIFVNFLIIARHGNDGHNQKLPETHIFQGFQRVNLYPYIIAIVDVIAAISPDVAPKMAASRRPSLNLPIHLHMLQIYLHIGIDSINYWNFRVASRYRVSMPMLTK